MPKVTEQILHLYRWERQSLSYMGKGAWPHAFTWQSRDLNTCSVSTDPIRLIRGCQSLTETWQDRLLTLIAGSFISFSKSFLTKVLLSHFIYINHSLVKTNKWTNKQPNFRIPTPICFSNLCFHISSRSVGNFTWVFFGIFNSACSKQRSALHRNQLLPLTFLYLWKALCFPGTRFKTFVSSPTPPPVLSP